MFKATNESKCNYTLTLTYKTASISVCFYGYDFDTINLSDRYDFERRAIEKGNEKKNEQNVQNHVPMPVQVDSSHSDVMKRARVRIHSDRDNDDLNPI